MLTFSQLILEGMLAAITLNAFTNFVIAKGTLRALRVLEAPPGFEPGNKGFANLCLNHLAMAPRMTARSLTF